MANKLKESLEEIYLDYFNNYLTVAKFAEHYGLTIQQGQQLLNLGRSIYESRMKEARWVSASDAVESCYADARKQVKDN